MKKNLLIFVIVGLVLFLGCSNPIMDKNDDSQNKFFEPTSVGESQNCIEFQTFYLAGEEVNTVYVCPGNIYSFVEGSSYSGEYEDSELKHPDRYLYLEMLIYAIENGEINLVSEQKEMAFVNQLKAIIKNNSSYNGFANKMLTV